MLKINLCTPTPRMVTVSEVMVELASWRIHVDEAMEGVTMPASIREASRDATATEVMKGKRGELGDLHCGQNW